MLNPLLLFEQNRKFVIMCPVFVSIFIAQSNVIANLLAPGCSPDRGSPSSATELTSCKIFKCMLQLAEVTILKRISFSVAL